MSWPIFTLKVSLFSVLKAAYSPNVLFEVMIKEKLLKEFICRDEGPRDKN